MSVTKYQIYLKTVELGSFTAAARALNFTQSGVSHAIGSLEEELGVTLLVRSHGGVTPTADGRALAPYFQEMCALSHRLEQHAEDLRGLDTGLIRVATFTSVSEKWLPGMLKTFQEKYPRIEFELLPSNFNNEISDWVYLPAHPGGEVPGLLVAPAGPVEGHPALRPPAGGPPAFPAGGPGAVPPHPAG